MCTYQKKCSCQTKQAVYEFKCKILRFKIVSQGSSLMQRDIEKRLVKNSQQNKNENNKIQIRLFC